MKVIFSMAVIGLSLGAFAQQGSDRVRQSLENLRTSPGLQLSLLGTEYYGSRTTEFGADAVFFETVDVNGNMKVQAEILASRAGAYTHRWVGDGTTLWWLNLPKAEYAQAKYGSFTGTNPDNYKTNFFQSLATWSQDSAVYEAKLLQDVYDGGYADFHSWAGAAEPITVEGPGNSHTDPLTDEVYRSTATTTYVIYELGSPVRRTVAYKLVYTNGMWNLHQISFADSARIGNKMRLSTFSILTVLLDTAPDRSHFSFSPPSGARPISQSKPSGGS